MGGAMAASALDLWNHWSIRVVVFLSFVFQVALFLLAPARRREGRWFCRGLLWLSYQLADSAATYALGHLALTGAPREYHLLAFWSPFLLLHLGGPDNISAYSLEDSKLWLRHLLSLFVQVLGAVYVLIKHFMGSGKFLLYATVLMFFVGFVKYGERTLALKRGNLGSIRSSVKKEPRGRCLFYLEKQPPQWGFKRKADEEEFLMRHAHSLFHICKCAIVESSDSMEPDSPEINVLDHLTYQQKYAMMEMELSLMYDILYTKAAVIHTLPGYCIRFITTGATAAVFLLFQFSGADGYSIFDVVITYILVVGAFLLETRSLLGAVLSSWTLPFLCGTRWRWLQHAVLCSGRWNRLRHVAASLHRFMGLGSYSRSARRWSGTIGQYNMFHLCTRPSKNSASGSLSPWDSIPLLGRLAKMLGHEEWWDRKHYSSTIKISEDLKERLLSCIEQLPKEGKMSTQGVVRKKWGKEALEFCKLKDRLKNYLGVEFQEGIIIWHMATDVFLAQHTQVVKAKEDEAPLVEAVRALSNYMMFLLVERPYMLPGLSQSRLYRRTCENLMDIWRQEAPSSNPSMLKDLFRLRDDPNSRSSLREIERLAIILYQKRDELEATPEVPRLVYATVVAKRLLDNDEDENREWPSVRVLLFVWKDFLVHAANRCGRESHAKKLGTGGELTTILWLFGEHSLQLKRFSRAAKAAKNASQQASAFIV